MRRSTSRTTLTTLTAVVASGALAVSGCNAVSDSTGDADYDETAAISDEVDEDTVLRIGDPRTQTALEASGLIDELDFTPEWANIDGGPKTLEAFRAD
ncbi:MAG: hypothetical protein L0K56_09635, partial [Corynebacterium sp.]|nr:hypothetical protein [Corynebacterium sp.]